MQLEQSPIPYRVEHTSNRASRATYDHTDNMIVIRLAHRLSAAEEQRHIDTLLRRMSRSAAKLRNTSAIDPFRSLLKGEMVSTVTFGDGTSREFRIEHGTKTRAKISPHGTWMITHSDRMLQKPFHAFLWKLLAKSERERITTLVHQINKRTLNVPIQKVTLRLTRTRWGSCSATGNISLSTPLLFLPPEILEYVIVHELAHVIHRNHSARFWAEVERYLPNYKETIKSLKKYRLPVL